MRTIAIVSQKSGAGKTTLAVHLAAEAAADGVVTLLIDTDPQATASRWSEWRKGSEPRGNRLRRALSSRGRAG